MRRSTSEHPVTGSSVRRHGRARGFTLVELVIAVAITSLLATTALPLIIQSVDFQREDEALRELRAIGEALDVYYYANAVFPDTLDDPAFLGPVLWPGTRSDTVRDPWNAGAFYLYVPDPPDDPTQVTVRSVGRNGVDEGGAGDDHQITIRAEDAGMRRTRDQVREIARALDAYGAAPIDLFEDPAQRYFEGDWPNVDRAKLSLGSDLDLDGWGRPFITVAGTLSVFSAGFDGIPSTADDVTL